MNPLTCWSCLHCTITGCELHFAQWPNMRLNECSEGQYEPGTDEQERTVNTDDT